jgi:hypothetical protein
MVIQCPYCGTTRDSHKEIRHGTKLRCPFCRNVFRPPLVGTAAPKADDPRFDAVVDVVLDELPTPPSLPPSRSPETEHPENTQPVMVWNSTKLAAGVLGISVLGLCIALLSWNLREGSTSKQVSRGPHRRGSYEQLNSADPPPLPELPVAERTRPPQESAPQLPEPSRAERTRPPQ